MDEEENSSNSELMTRADYAYALAVRGLSYQEIGLELHCSADVVGQIISKQLGYEADQLSVENKNSMLALENARLNAVQRAHWSAMEMGDPKSSDIVLRVIALRSKINKLDVPDAVINQNTVLVIGGQQADYIEKLKELSA